MTALDFEFVRRRHVPWAGLIFLAFAIAVGIAVLSHWLDLRKVADAKELRLETLNRSLKDARRAAQDSHAKASPQEERLEKSRKEVLLALTYPWNRVFADIEQSSEDNVALLSFSHDQDMHETQLSAEAPDVPALVRFVGKLNDADDDNRWYIASYQLQMQSMPMTVKAAILSK